MDWILALKAIVLGIVEGLTEFLPVSSTGHLIVAEDLIGFHTESREVFTVAIQSGAILAVLWEFRARILRVLSGVWSSDTEQRLVINVAIAFMPAAILGVMFKRLIEQYLFFSVPVAAALIVGGIVILWVEHAHARRDYKPRVDSIDELTALDAFKVGCAQCFSLIPGTSRSGATIIGGLLFGLSRKAATEFSFFLAIPTVIGATLYSLYKARNDLHMHDLPLFALGNVAAFISALVCVRWLLRYVANNDFRLFAWYRIIFGAIILLTAHFGLVNFSD